MDPTEAEWAASLVFVPQNGSFQFCVNYRKLNTETVLESYSLSRLDDFIDSFENEAVFSSFPRIATIGK